MNKNPRKEHCVFVGYTVTKKTKPPNPPKHSP